MNKDGLPINMKAKATFLKFNQNKQGNNRLRKMFTE
jgi:hypothetical protein